MSKIEEVKKIDYSYTCSCGRKSTIYHTDAEAQQICQLFPNCNTCFYKSRYTPPKLYDSDFGRITGSQRP